MSAFIPVLILTSGLCVLFAFLPSMAFINAVLWGTAFIYGALYLRAREMLIILGVNLLLIYSFAGGSAFIFFFTFFGLAAAGMGMLITYNADYYQVQKWGILVACMGTTLFLGFMLNATGGIGTGEMEKQLSEAAEQTMQLYEENGIFNLNLGINREELQEGFQHMVKSVTKHLPAFYYLQAIMAAFFMLFLATFLSLKRGILRLKKKPFFQEVLPWPIVWLIIAGLGLLLWGWEEKSIVYYTGSNLLVILTPVVLYFGLAAFAYRIKKAKLSRTLLILTAVVLTAFAPLMVICFLAVIGILDSLLDLRKANEEQEE